MKISEKKFLEFILNEAISTYNVNLEDELSFEYDEEIGISWENVAAFCKHKLTKIDERYEKNRIYKTKKQSEKNDSLREAILGIVTDTEEYMNLNQILTTLDNPDITPQALGVRLGKLVKEGILESETKNIEGRRLKHYRRMA